MPNRILHSIPHVTRTYNFTRTISQSFSTTTNSLSLIDQTIMPTKRIPVTSTEISPAACVAFVLLILTTVGGNTLVLSALFLDKRLHTPSFYLIANMAIADLLLGLCVLPFSSVLELLNDRWIFGQSFCSAWLAMDVLCCTASIIALMGVSIDRYIGVTRPLNYSSTMTTRRTIYLIIVVWAVSILTSVVPLFGLTDREKPSNDLSATQEHYETCKVNKNTFYTIFSSMISFYIPVIILLILYSRVYQEAKKQGEKLENEKRRLYQIDYQIASEYLRRKQLETNGHLTESPNSTQVSPRIKRTLSSISDVTNNEVKTEILNNEIVSGRQDNLDPNLNLNDKIQFKKDYTDPMNGDPCNNTSNSSLTVARYLSTARRSFHKHLSKTFKRNFQEPSHVSAQDQDQQNAQMSRNDELLIIKRKLHNLKREKKAFRTLGLILSALLICWLPFFVTLPVISILKHHGILTAEDTENTWFKITFWLGYCNSALNPFVYAFSNRAIRRAFRQVIFRRFCCCDIQCWFCRYFCRKKCNEFDQRKSTQDTRNNSYTLPSDSSQLATKQSGSLPVDLLRTVPKLPNDSDPLLSASSRTAGSGENTSVSFNNSIVEIAQDNLPSRDRKKSSEGTRIALIPKIFIDATSDS